MIGHDSNLKNVSHFGKTFYYANAFDKEEKYYQLVMSTFYKQDLK